MSAIGQDVLQELSMLGGGNSIMTRLNRVFGDTVETLDDLMHKHRDVIFSVQKSHDLLLQGKNFIVVGMLASGALNTATAAKKIMEGFPMILTDQAVANVITSTQIGTSAVHLVLASAMLINASLEAYKISEISKDVSLWIEKNLDEYGHHFQAVKENGDKIQAIGDELSREKIQFLNNLAERAEWTLLQKMEQHENAEHKFLRQPDEYVKSVRRFAKEDRKYSSWASDVSQLSSAEKEYFYLLIKQRQLHRVTAEKQSDIQARLAVNVNDENREKLTEILQRYRMSSLGNEHARFHTMLTGLLQPNNPDTEKLKTDPEVQARNQKLQQAADADVVRSRRKVALSVLNVLGSIAMLSALLLAPVCPPASIALFAAAISVNVVLLHYGKEFPSLSGIFLNAKEKFFTNRMRGALFNQEASTSHEEKEIQRLAGNTIRKIQAVLPPANSEGETVKKSLCEYFAEGPYAAYHSVMVLLNDFKNDLQENRLTLADSQKMTDRILDMMREALKVPATDRDLMASLTSLYQAVPGAPALDLAVLQADISQAQITSLRVSPSR